MTSTQYNHEWLSRTTCGNAEAADFLVQWLHYIHEIDDIVDGERTTPEAILSTFARAPMLYSHPFYLAHLAELRRLVLVINNLYADCVRWEKSDRPWQREFADHNRHAGMEMAIAVAQICGGYEHGRSISTEHREICWQEHHDPKGQTI